MFDVRWLKRILGKNGYGGRKELWKNEELIGVGGQEYFEVV